jgi:hypothetical protein
MDKKLAEANRVFHQISRLANCGKGMSFQAMRQLYLACITSIADYGVPIWWKGQGHYLDKFQKLQNSILRKILGAFRTSPIAAMELEAAILPTRIRLDKICKNYALRAIQLDQDHPIKRRTPESFPFSGGIDIDMDWNSYLDWNQKDKSGRKKYPTQLYQILHSISDIPSLNIEDTGFKKIAPWTENPITYNLEAARGSKEEVVAAHAKEIQDISLQNTIIGYSDGSKLDNQDTGAGISLINGTTFPETYEEHTYYLGKFMEVYDAELLAILKTL